MRIQQEDRRKREAFDWILWLKWILVNTLGWATGLALGIEFVIGALIGGFQWLVLRPLLRDDGWWIPASAVGWAAGAALVTLVLRPESALLGPAVIGAGLGLGQWLVLRPQIRGAWWWIVLSTLGWAVAMTGVLGASLVGAVAGAVTGVGLEFLLRYPRAEDDAGASD